MQQFVDNLKKLNIVLKGYANSIAIESQKELKEVEGGINALFENNLARVFSYKEA
jgi:hypothetical protein